jgi:CRP-like cAMP-binding protein
MLDSPLTLHSDYNWSCLIISLPHTSIHVKAKETLALSERIHEIGCIESGVMLSSASNEDGIQKSLWVASGHYLYSQQLKGLYTTTKALTDATLLWTDRDRFMDCIRSDQDLFDHYLNDISSKLNHQIRRSLSLQEDSGRARLYEYMLQLTLTFGRPTQEDPDVWLLPNIFPREDLASLAGIHQSNCSRYLTELRQEGILSKHAHDDAPLSIPQLQKAIERERAKHA